MTKSNKEEFLAAYHDIHEPLMRFCIVKSRGIMDAKDLANDVLLIGLEKYDDLKNKKALLSYLFTTANNICLGHLRRKKFSGSYSEEAAHKMPDPTNRIESSVDVGILYEALDRLPEIQREALVLFEISDLPIKEIMVIQNAGESSVKQRIKRGREKLAAIMQEKDRKKVAVVIAISLTSNSFSMSNLNEYFEAIKMMPLPISKSEAITKISKFHFAKSSTSKLIRMISNNKVIGVLVGGAVVASALSLLASPGADDQKTSKQNTSILASIGESDNFQMGNSIVIFPNENTSDMEVINHQESKVAIVSTPAPVETYHSIFSPGKADASEFSVPVSTDSLFENNGPKPRLEIVKIDTILKNQSIYDLVDVDEIVINDIGEKIEIRTWNKNAVKVESTVEVDSKKEKDRLIIVENTKVVASKEGKQFIIDSNLEIDCNSIIQIGGVSQKSIKFENGEKAKCKKLTRSYIITVPKKRSLKLNNSFSDVKMGDLEGDLRGNMYESNFDAGSITGEVKMGFKYSKVNLKNFQSARFTTYETNLNFGNCTKLSLASKYSKINGGRMKSLQVKSYTDQINIAKSDSIGANMKYSSLKLAEAVKAFKVTAYESKISAESVDVFELKAVKYCKIQANQVDDLDINVIYDCNLAVNVIGNIHVEKSKYSKYSIKTLLNEASVSSYDDKLDISQVSPQFRQLKFSGEYSKYKLSIDTTSAYELDIKTHYSNLDYSNLHLQEKSFTKKNDQISLNGTVNSETKTALAKIIFNCREGSIFLK